jgi:hypothetical protein
MDAKQKNTRSPRNLSAATECRSCRPPKLRLFVHGFAVVLLAICAADWAGLAEAAGYRTANFVIEAPTQELARKIGDAAEQYRHDLALEWIGRPLPRWANPCPITAEVAAHLGAGGATSFVFDRGEVFGWQMSIQGSEQRILDSVLPHEVTHTIFASHFRQPLPRWADEGACTTVEHPSERARQHRMLIEFLTTGRGIAFPQMFAMREYPPDVLPLYAQGYSLARYLIERGGRRKYVDFVGQGLASGNWSAALQRFYGIAGPGDMQTVWLDWVREGCPAPPATMVAAAQQPSAVTRGQSPDADDPASTSIQLASVPQRKSIYQRVGHQPPAAAAAAKPGGAPQRTATSATSKVMW